MALDPIWGNIFRKKTSREEELISILKEVPIFEDLNRRELRQIERIVHNRTYAINEAVVEEGEPGMGMYIIRSGEVHVLQKTKEGEVQKLASYKEGDFFGDLALLDEAPRSASVIATEPCQMIGFFRPDLFDLIEQDPRLGLKIVLRLAQIIAARLRHTNEILKEIQAASDGKSGT